MKRGNVHLPEDVDFAGDPKPGKSTTAQDKTTTQLDFCRCPKCGGRTTARMGTRGPYFHCLCAERERSAPAPALLPVLPDGVAAETKPDLAEKDLEKAL